MLDEIPHEPKFKVGSLIRLERMTDSAITNAYLPKYICLVIKHIMSNNEIMFYEVWNLTTNNLDSWNCRYTELRCDLVEEP